MRTELCERLGIKVPIFAFTHCRDVVVQVSKAGGLGVLGAVGFTPAQLREELDWIDAHIGGLPYAVDIVIPQKYEGIGNTDPAELEKLLQSMVPQEHRDFAEKLLRDHGVPEWPDQDDRMGLLGWTEATATPLLDVALERPGVKLIANALGTPPKEVIDRIHASGRLVAALCGRVKQAIAHRDA
ncbi:MAG: nitronate monooxygenase, partial [Gammaproteobacteria bacterium]